MKRRKLSVSFVIKETGLLALENVGALIVTSLLWAILLLPGIILIPLPFAGIYIALVAPVGLAPIFRYIYLLMRHKRHRYELLRVDLPRRILAGLVVGLLLAFAFIVVYATWWYSLETGSAVYLSLSILQTYLALMLCLVSTYVLAIVSSEDTTILAAYKKSLRIFLLKPGFTVVLWIQILAIGLLFLITTMAFAILYGGLLALFLNVASEYAIRVLTAPEEEDMVER